MINLERCYKKACGTLDKGKTQFREKRPAMKVTKLGKGQAHLTEL